MYTRASPTARPVFHRLPLPTDADITALLTRLHRRVRRLLARRGRLPDDEGRDAFAVQAPLFASAVAASLQGRVALGPRAGSRCDACAQRSMRSRRGGAPPGWKASACTRTSWCRGADQLEKVCRYILRPPLAVARLTESTGGPLLYHFRRPWRDGSTALVLELLERLGRLVALVPPPRRPLLAYHGLLAPRARWRSTIVPPPAPDDGRADAGARSPRRWPRARLLHRVFANEVLVCDRCGGPRRILGAVTEPHAVRRLLTALGLANAAKAAQLATNRIPIVFAAVVGDPVALGLVQSFARPGGNITGVTDTDLDLSAKRLEATHCDARSRQQQSSMRVTGWTSQKVMRVWCGLSHMSQPDTRMRVSAPHSGSSRSQV